VSDLPFFALTLTNRHLADTMTYHVARNNTPLGTFTREDATARYARGEITSTDLVWTEGMTNWQPASQVLGASAAPVSGAAVGVPTLPGAASRPPKPDSHLAWAILTTLLCCLPLGVVSIVFATQVDSKYIAGDYAGAEAASGKAKTFAIISVALTAVVILGYAVAIGIAAASDIH
jgi:hypothetical protein